VRQGVPVLPEGLRSAQPRNASGFYFVT
jgi:hypothetical protein